MAMISPYGRTTCALQVGTLFALGALLAAGLVTLGRPQLAAAGAVPVAFGLFVLSFYRDPEREGPADPALCLSPADGVVTDIAEVDEPLYLGGRATRVGVFLSPLNVHVNRTPLAGTVEKVVLSPGKCLPATSPACIDANESALVGLRTGSGQRFALRQVTGALARSIVVGVREGDALTRGERYGMIKLGSRTELLVPVEDGFEPLVQVGDVVRGGLTVLGRLERAAQHVEPGAGSRSPAAGEEAA